MYCYQLFKAEVGLLIGLTQNNGTLASKNCVESFDYKVLSNIVNVVKLQD